MSKPRNEGYLDIKINKTLNKSKFCIKNYLNEKWVCTNQKGPCKTYTETITEKNDNICIIFSKQPPKNGTWEKYSVRAI